MFNNIDDVAKNNKYHNNDGEGGDDGVVIMVWCWTKGNPKTLCDPGRNSVQFA